MTRQIKRIDLVFFILFMSGSAFAQGVAVIANPASPTLTKDDIKSLYLGFRTTLPDGSPAKVLVLKGDGVKDRFMREVLGIAYRDFRAHWLSKALSGEGAPPRELTAEEIIDIVKREKGAIGFIPAEKVPEGVKVLIELK